MHNLLIYIESEQGATICSCNVSRETSPSNLIPAKRDDMPGFMNIKQLEAFVAVADLGSFRKAAERLGTTQPNISTRIAALESRLNVSLMERDAGSVRLTPKGADLLHRARDVLRAAEDFVAAADDGALFEGVIRLGVTEMIVHSWLHKFLQSLKQMYPNVIVELNVDLSVNLTRALFDHSIDLAFQSGPLGLRNTSGEVELDEYAYAWVASPSLGIDADKTVLDDLIAFPLLIQARGTLPYQQLAQHLAAEDARRARLAPSTSMSAGLQMAVEGLGVACMPEAMVADQVEAGALVRLNYDWTPEPLRFLARYHAESAAIYVKEAAALAARIARPELA